MLQNYHAAASLLTFPYQLFQSKQTKTLPGVEHNETLLSPAESQRSFSGSTTFKEYDSNKIGPKHLSDSPPSSSGSLWQRVPAPGDLAPRPKPSTHPPNHPLAHSAQTFTLTFT